MKAYDTKLKYTFLSIATVIAFLLLWQLLAVTGFTGIIPAPSVVFRTLLDKFSNPNPDGATLLKNIVISLKVSLTGLLLGIGIGVPLGWLMAWYEPVNKLVRPLFEFIRPIPPISWIPLTILWIGIGLGAKAMIIFFGCFVPCLINAYAGVKTTDQTLINVAKTFGASNFTTFRKVAIPSSLPLTFTGMRTALNCAWSTLVAAELLAANAGVGYMITMGRSVGRVDIVIAGMITIGVIGYVFSRLFDKIESIVVKWRTL